MKLAPGTPLAANLAFGEGQPTLAVARLAMAGGLAQLEWSPELIAAPLPVSALLYPPEPGLHPARRREFEGLHGLPRGNRQSVLASDGSAAAGDHGSMQASFTVDP